MTIREEINRITNEIKSKRDMMTPMIASDRLMELTVWHSSLTAHISEFQFKYNKKLSSILETDEKLPISKAEIIAKASDEYKQLDEALRLEKSLVEIIRSLKIWIKSRAEEYHISSNI